MNCPVNYPDVAEVIPCFTEVVRVLRAGTLLEERDHVAKHLWAIVGAGLKASLGDPDVAPVIGAKAIPWSLLIAIAMKLLERFLPKEQQTVGDGIESTDEEIANTFELALAA